MCGYGCYQFDYSLRLHALYKNKNGGEETAVTSRSGSTWRSFFPAACVMWLRLVMPLVMMESHGVSVAQTHDEVYHSHDVSVACVRGSGRSAKGQCRIGVRTVEGQWKASGR